MRLIRYNFVFVLGLILTIGLSTAMAGDKDKNRGAKIPKGMAALRVTTNDISKDPTNATYPVKLDGRYIGQSGANTFAEYIIEPGFHTVEVTGPDGKTYSREIEFRRGVRECICLNVSKEIITKDCPYRYVLERSKETIQEGETVTFTARNVGTAMAVNYVWRVVNGTIESGQGKDTIVVDSTGMGNKTIEAELDVNDDVYDGRCRQVITVPTSVEGRTEVTPTPIQCDEFEYKTEDYLKAVSDNCMIMAQNTPDSRLYIDIYPGTDKRSMTRNTYERLSKRNLDYLIKRGFDPSRLTFRKGSSRTTTSYVIWVVPTGAEIPAIR